MESWQTVVHNVIHVSGGLRADLSDSNKLKLFPTAKGEGLRLGVSGPSDTARALGALGLVILGTEQISESKSLLHRVWNPICYRKLFSPNGLPPAELWATFAHAARKTGDAESAGTMRSISFALTAMGRRLRDISENYNEQLKAALEDGANKDARFSNTQVLDLFLNCHAFLTEACSARDYLARFLARHVYNGVQADSAATLLRRKSSSSHPIDGILGAANDKASPAAWMIRMNEYRDIITHRAPLSHMGSGSGTLIELRFPQPQSGKPVPRIIVPIPADPFNHGSSASTDALILFRSYGEELLNFAAECARYSPVPSEIPRFDQSNIISIKPAS